MTPVLTGVVQFHIAVWTADKHGRIYLRPLASISWIRDSALLYALLAKQATCSWNCQSPLVSSRLLDRVEQNAKHTHDSRNIPNYRYG